MKPTMLTLGPLDAPDADGIALTQTPAGGGVQNLTLNGALVAGGVATMDAPRRIGITSAADDSGRVFTVYGTDRYGNTVSEEITGAAIGEAVSQLDYVTITAITVDDNTAGALTAGTNQIASTQWVAVDTYRNPVQIGLRVDISGTLECGIEHTFDPVYNSPGPFAVAAHDTLTALAAGAQGNYAFPVAAYRLTLSTYTSPATATLGAIQAGLRGG